VAAIDEARARFVRTGSTHDRDVLVAEIFLKATGKPPPIIPSGWRELPTMSEPTPAASLSELTTGTTQTLIAASLHLAIQSLNRSHQLVADARTALFAILAVNVAAMLGLVTLVATLAAGHLGAAPGKWWFPGLALVVSFGVALSGLVGRLKSKDVAQGTLLGTALAKDDDKEALNAFDRGIMAAAKANLGVAGDLERRALIAIVFFVLALALAFVPIGVNFTQVFPL
jgi:hypothetical protein